MTVIIILSLLVILHELGHFFMAIWLKIKVEEFGLGYPPKAKRLFNWLGTEFSLNWIPFGGFVRLWGEDPSAEEPVQPQPSKTKSLNKKIVQPFYDKPLWQRFLVMVAGPAMNILVALVLFAVVFSIDGIPVFLEGKARIDRVLENTPAAQAGLPAKYQIIGFAPAGTSADKLTATMTKLDRIPTVQQFVAEHRGQTWQVVLEGPCHLTHCESNQKVVELRFRLAEETPANEGAIGVRFAEYELQFYPWYEMPWRGMWFGVQQAVSMSQMMLKEVGHLVTDLIKGKGLSSAVAGPIGIVHQAEKMGLSQAGWQEILSFAGMLSLNLAVMNLLPIPALDGGRIFLLLLEIVLGKARVARFEGYLNNGGFLLLIGLLIVISARDIRQIFIK